MTLDDSFAEIRGAKSAQSFLIRPEIIRIGSKEYGSGQGWVYCYYFPYVRRITEKTSRPIWPCKIGMSEQEDVRSRIAQQFVQTGIFEAPEIGFIARSANPRVLEFGIRNWFPESRRLRGGEGLGTEWLEANIGEVRRAYREVLFPRWFHWPKRIWLLFQMAVDSWRDARAIAQK